MDPNETVQKLINQDTFHEVKRKRDKKKENENNNDSELRSRSFAGPSVQGGRGLDRGGGRGTSIPRVTMRETSGRGKFYYARESGTHQIYRVTNSTSASFQLRNQLRPIASTTSNAGGSSFSNGIASQESPGSFMPISGHATMAQVVKSSIATNAAPVMPLDISESVSGHDVPTVGQSPSMDPCLVLTLEDPVTLIKQEAVPAENCRTMNEHGPDLPDEVGPIFVPPLPPPEIPQCNINVLDTTTFISEGKSHAGSDHEDPVDEAQTTNVGGSSEVQWKPSSRTTGTLGTRHFLGNRYKTRAIYQPQQPVGSERAAAGLKWKASLPVENGVLVQGSPVKLPGGQADETCPPVSLPISTEMISLASSKLQELNVKDDRPVIIPNHLQVAEAECAGLRFGSFDAGFGSITGLGSDDNKSLKSVEDDATEEVLSEQPSVSSMTDSTPVSTIQSYPQQPISTTLEVLDNGNEAMLSMPSVTVSKPEISRPEPTTEQTPQFSYVPTVPSYHGFGLMPQLQYPFESAESQRQEIPRLPSVVQPFPDISTNYYSPLLRPGSDADAHYQFASTNTAAKLGGNVTLMTWQTLPSSQENGNLMVFSSAGPAGHLPQSAGITQTTLAMAQQPVRLRAYPTQPAGVPISPYASNVFGYQYVPPNYAYMHTPFQHSYIGSNSYLQPPAGSSYSPGGSTPSPAGAATVKYPVPHYKPHGAVAGNAALATGYSGFASTPAGFAAINPTVNVGFGSSYDDMVGPQFKESNLFIPNQQGEGSAVWVQGLLPRNISGMQSNSYYSLHGQGQHAGFAHPQSVHAHPAPAYTSLYHLSQSTPGPSTHQLLQQPQALGPIGAGSQAVAYQQPQRGQLNWTNNY